MMKIFAAVKSIRIFSITLFQEWDFLSTPIFLKEGQFFNIVASSNIL